MPPTKFWAEMSWRDFAAADMAKTVAVLPVAAIEQHGPHLPVGTDAFIGEGYLQTRDRARARRLAGAVPAAADDRRFRRARRISGHADVAVRDAGRRADGDRRRRRARRLPQARLHQFARRQRAGDRRGGADLARAPRDAVRARELAAARLSRRPVLRARARLRRARRRRRDFADPRLPPRRGEDGPRARFRQRGRSDGRRLQAPARRATARLRLDGERPQSRRRRRRSRVGDGGQGRGRRRPRRRRLRRAHRATSSPSISRDSPAARSADRR